MKRLSLRLSLCVTVLSACSRSEQITPPEPTDRVAITVSALRLEGVTDAEFTIKVENGASPRQVVWTQSGLSSRRYGDGAGGLSFVGPCDAQKNQNRVTLVLEALYTTGPGDTRQLIPASSYQNPTPLSKIVTCRPNADAPVDFNLVVMRDATQGFFDIAVNFEDIFCSAKVDCKREFLFDGDDRALTFIAALACTTGKSEHTWLYLDDYRLSCTRGGVTTSIPIDPGQSPGQHGPLGTGVYEHAVYTGREAFQDVEKCFWNTAIGVRESWLAGATSCSITGQATAATTEWTTMQSPTDTVYPVIDIDVPIYTAAAGLLCANHPLNGEPAGVHTGYTELDEDGESFDNKRPCGLQKVACDVPVQGATSAAAVSVEGAGGGARVAFTASLGGRTFTADYALPKDVTLDTLDGCCADICCAAD